MKGSALVSVALAALFGSAVWSYADEVETFTGVAACVGFCGDS